jgi:hypothetical protein
MRIHSQQERRKLELEGARLASLIVGWKWIDRRVESVTFIGETRALRDVSITLTLPDHVQPALYAGMDKRPRGESEGADTSQARSNTASTMPPFYYVPLTLIDKEKMTRFDFTDEDGASLPLLGSTEKGIMAAGLLVALAEEILRDEDMSLPQPIASELRAIAEARPKRAMKLFQGFMERSQLQGGYSTLHGNSRNAHVLRALLLAFAQCYMLVVPLAQGLHHKRLIKFSYEENVTFKVAPRFEGNFLKRAAQWARRLGVDLTRTFGWRARQIWLGAPAFGHGGTYHLEMSAPPGTKITQMTLVGMTVTPQVNESEITWTSSQDDGISAPLEEQYQPHICCREKKPGAFAVAYTKIRPTSPTVIRAAFFSAVGTAVVLIAGIHFLSHMLTAENELAAAGAALLLAVPTAASVYISRIQEHPMVTSMLLGVRLASLLSGVSAYAAASVLIVGRYVHASGNWLAEAEFAWIVCSVTATLAAGMLMATYFATWKEDQKLIPRWRRYKARWATPPTYPPPPAAT